MIFIFFRLSETNLQVEMKNCPLIIGTAVMEKEHIQIDQSDRYKVIQHKYEVHKQEEIVLARPGITATQQKKPFEAGLLFSSM